jgi:hypothetical protein
VPLFLLLLDFLYFSPVPFFSAISPSSFSFYWIIFTRINTYFNIFYPKKEKARKNSLRTPSLSRDCLPIHIWASWVSISTHRCCLEHGLSFKIHVVEARSPKCYEDVLWSLLSGGTSRCAGVSSG